MMGAGAWGTALAKVLADAGNNVALSWAWAYDTTPGVVLECQCAHELEFRVLGAPTGKVNVTTSTP